MNWKRNKKEIILIIKNRYYYIINVTCNKNNKKSINVF